MVLDMLLTSELQTLMLVADHNDNDISHDSLWHCITSGHFHICQSDSEVHDFILVRVQLFRVSNCTSQTFLGKPQLKSSQIFMRQNMTQCRLMIALQESSYIYIYHCECIIVSTSVHVKILLLFVFFNNSQGHVAVTVCHSSSISTQTESTPVSRYSIILLFVIDCL